MCLNLPFEGLLLLSDIDGTLATYDRQLVAKNRAAIERFMALGGLFGVATGRTARSAKKMMAGFPMNAPSLVVNGGGIYDIAADRTLFRCYLSHKALSLVEPVVTAVPGVGIEINNNGLLQCVRYSPRSEQHVRYECGDFTQYSLADLPQNGNWHKLLFTGREDEIDEVEAICRRLVQSGDPYYAIRSEPTLFEILPVEACKGKSLVRLAEMLGIPLSHTYAIGDYYNDIPLLSAAGTAATVAGAPPEVQAATDYVTCPCEEGAVADFIGWIERRLA